MSLLVAILVWVLFGFLVGFVARALYPGNQGMSFGATAALGIVGSLVGGILASLIWHHDLMELHPVGFIGSVLGAMVFLAISTSLKRVNA